MSGLTPAGESWLDRLRLRAIMLDLQTLNDTAPLGELIERLRYGNELCLRSNLSSTDSVNVGRPHPDVAVSLTPQSEPYRNLMGDFVRRLAPSALVRVRPHNNPRYGSLLIGWVTAIADYDVVTDGRWLPSDYVVRRVCLGVWLFLDEVTLERLALCVPGSTRAAVSNASAAPVAR